MKKFINLRVPVLCACVLSAGVGTGYAFSYYNADVFWVTAIVLVVSLLVGLFIFLKKPKLIALVIALAAFFAVAFFNCYAHLETYKVCKTDTTQSVYVTGEVLEKSDSFIILGSPTADGEKVDGKIRVYLSTTYGDFCDVGYTVEFYAKLSAYDAFPYGKLNYNAENNVKYSCSVYGGLVSKYGFSLFGSIRSGIRDTLYDNLDGETAAICYALLIGDTGDIEENSLQSFRYGGIAHIFAVSGLHIGLIFGLAAFICKKLLIGKPLAAVICVAVILFYAGVCGFTLSSIRAVIMCCVSIFAGIAHVKKDGLNSIAFAVIIILTVTPLSLFSVGFQLSVCAVGGIHICSGFLTRLMKKLKAPAVVSKAVASSFGAQLGTFPIMLANFGYVSGAGIILNPVILPVLSVFYVFVFFATMLSTVIPPLGILLYFAAIPLEGVTSFLITAGFEKTLISGFGAGWFIPLYFIGLLFVTDKFNFKWFQRAIGFAISVLALTLFVIVQTYSPLGGGVNIYISGYYGGGNVVFKTSQGSVLVMTEGADVSRIIGSLNESYTPNPDYIIVLGGDNCSSSYDPELGVKSVYLYDGYVPVQPYRGVQFYYEHEFELCGISFEFVDGYSVICDLGDTTIGVCSGSDISIESCDLLVSKTFNYDFDKLEEPCDAAKTVYFGLKGCQYSIYDSGMMKFRFN